MRNLFTINLVKLFLPGVIFTSLVLLSVFFFNDTFHNLDSPRHHLYFLNAGYRLGQVEDSILAMEKTGQYLLKHGPNVERNGIQEPSYISIESNGDDPGLYYFVSLLVKTFGLDIYTAYLLLCSIFIFGGYFVGSIGAGLLCKSAMARVVSFLLLGLFTFFCLYILDVYVLAFFATSFIPLLIWITNKYLHENKISLFIIIIFITGLVSGIANQFRSHAGTGVLLFTVLYLLCLGQCKLKLSLRLAFISVFVISSLFPKYYFNALRYYRDVNLNKISVNHVRVQSPSNAHVFWHSLYVGLGFIENNKHGIKWDDYSAYNKAKEIMPTLNENFMNSTPEYETIIKGLYLKVLKDDVSFAVKTYLSKTLYNLALFLICFNIGILFLFLKRPPLNLTIPYVAAIGFYILPGILVWPFPMYILGALSMAVFATIFLIGDYFSKPEEILPANQQDKY